MKKYELFVKDFDEQTSVLNMLWDLNVRCEYGKDSCLHRNSWSYLIIYQLGNRWTTGANSKSKENYIKVTLSDLIKVLYPIKKPIKDITIKLNSNYDAVITSDSNIKVGCQTFTFDQFYKLEAEVNKMAQLIKDN